MGNLGAEKAKNQGLGWQQGCGGGRIGESSRGKMGEYGEKWGKMGRKWGGNGGKGDRLQHPSFLTSPHFPPFPPHFPPFSPIFPCHGYIVGTFVGTVPATGAGYF